MGSYQWWMFFTSAYWEYKANSDHYGRWWSNDEIKPYINSEITTKGGEHIIFTDNGDKDIGKWWQDYRILLNVDAENGEYDTDGTLTYSISGGQSNALYINPTWGNVTFKGGGGVDLDIRLKQYNFTVTATSSSHLNPAVSKHFQLKIIEGEYNPEFISSGNVSTSYNEIIETAANENIAIEEYMVVLDVDAVGGNHSYQFGGAGIHYSITGGSKFFLNAGDGYVKIDQNTGVISLNLEVFFLGRTNGRIEVTATSLDDDGNLTQYSATQNISIYLDNSVPVIVENVIYEDAPIFITDLSKVMDIVLQEESPEHVVSYFLFDQNAYGNTGFNINDEGVVSYTGNPTTVSYEDASHYVVVLAIVPSLSIKKRFDIEYDVVDVNEGIQNTQLLSNVSAEENVFSARQYDLNDYFTDLDGDELNFSVVSQIKNNMSILEEKLSFAGVIDNVLYVDYQLGAQSSFVIDISATDGEFTAYDTLVVDIA